MRHLICVPTQGHVGLDPEVNPTIVSYNATRSLVRFENKTKLFYF
jgi:hypothetical protein